MSAEDQYRKQIDDIALSFETEWHLTRSAQWLAECYSRCPCDELLAYLVSADAELASVRGVQRDIEYYLTVFPGKLAVIEAALQDENHPPEFSTRQPVNEDSQLELTSQFFASVPCMFGKYRIVRCIGRGGMAAVFQAELDGQPVALKLPYRQYQGTSKFNDRFQKEIRLLSNLTHPNIVPILDSGRIDGLSYYTMPLIDGEGLNEQCSLDRLASLSPTQATAYMLQATQAIANSHAHGILHRDIKPSNILVDSRDHVWVVDFGLATVVDSDHSLTRDGQILGTPTWMPPEQARGDYSRVDQRSDVYSLGATLYSLLTGRPPFAGPTTGDLLIKIQHQDLTPPRHLYRHVPKDLQNIVLKCMEKNPRHRYPNAAALAEDLQAFLEGKQVSARAPHVALRAYRWCRLYPRWTTGAAAIVLILSILLVSTFVFRHIANLQNQIAYKAQEQRDNALRSEEQQRHLRNQAEKARRKADDAVSFGEAQQLKTAFANMDTQVRAGHFGYAEDAYLFPTRVSLDTEWYTRQKQRRPKEIRSLSTGHWGHYDAALNGSKTLLATVGRNGDVAIWDHQSELLVKYCHFAQRDPEKGFAWIRWRYATNNTVGFTPKAPPEFFSSLAWTSQETLLVAGLDGKLVEHSLNDVEPRCIYRSQQPLYFVRTNQTRDRYLVADELGNCCILDSSGNVLAQAALQMQPSWIGFSSLHQAWIYASVDGELVYLNSELTELGRLSTGAQIHDVEELNRETSQILVISHGKPPSLFRIEDRDHRLVFSLQKVFLGQSDSEAPSYCQALIDDKHQQIVTMDDNGGLAIWNLDHDRATTFRQLTATKDIRRPYPSELEAYDWLERRSRYFLLDGDQGTITLDCMGTLRELDTTSLTAPPGWNTYAAKVGPDARIAANPLAAAGLWALDKAGVLRYVDLGRDKVLAEHKSAHTGGYTDLQVLSNGDVYTAGRDQAIRVWRFQNSSIQLIRELNHLRPLLSVAVHEGRGLVASVDIDGSIQLFDLKTGAIRHAFPSSSVTDPLPVHTGRVAFSPTGRFLVAFSCAQDCKCVDIDSMTLTHASHIGVAGAGGIDVVFSSDQEVEHRFLTSSIGTIGNEIEQTQFATDPAVMSSGDQRTTVDFAIPGDRQRVIRLCGDGDLVFCSPEHFVPLSTIKGPTHTPCSLAITQGDSSLVVASSEGDLYTWLIEPQLLAAERVNTLNCSFVPMDGAEALVYAKPSALEGLNAIQDRSGHLTTTFVAGGLSNKSQLNRLFVVKKTEQRWSVKPLEFEGDKEGPCEHATLIKTPNDQLCAIIRQGQISKGDYNGRVLLATETDGVWKSEVVEPEGNSGFSPFPVFSLNGHLECILHVDHWYQRWFANRRSSQTGAWERSTVLGNMGVKTSGVRDSAGTIHLITRHLRGFDSAPPHQYVVINTEGQYRYEKAQGDMLFANRNDQFFSYDTLNGSIWLKKSAVGWDYLGRLPLQRLLRMQPSLDREDQMWWAWGVGGDLFVVRCDMSQLCPDQDLAWHFYHGPIHPRLTTSSAFFCNRNSDGVLEILVLQGGQSMLGMIEATIPD